ncbi:MAG: hypothetical protein ILO53_09060, partial [Clostridia bacterium]|nr:hypothetical protein [Clostridia bacterium]
IGLANLTRALQDKRFPVRTCSPFFQIPTDFAVHNNTSLVYSAVLYHTFVLKSMGFDEKTASNCTNNFENAALFGINAALIHIEYN